MQLHCDNFGDIIDRSVTTHYDLWLTLCLLCIFLHAFLSFADFFFKIICFKNSFSNTMKVSNSLDPYQAQAQKSVRPDLGLNCLQKIQQTTLIWKF